MLTTIYHSTHIHMYRSHVRLYSTKVRLYSTKECNQHNPQPSSCASTTTASTTTADGTLSPHTGIRTPLTAHHHLNTTSTPSLKVVPSHPGVRGT